MDMPCLPQDRVAAWRETASVEVSPRDTNEALPFAPGTTVFVNNPPSVTHHDIVAACRRVAASDCVPVPHVVARHLTGFTQANDFLARLAGEAGVEQILLLGGDASRPAGPFGSALDVMATGVVENHYVREVAFAGYPEGHPHITAVSLRAALQAKVALARSRGLAVSLVTQFGFEAEAIVTWIAAQRSDGLDCPIRIGVAGPASVATLAKYAVRCGIGTSLRALARGHAAFARVLTEATPDALVEDLAVRLDPGEPAGLHVFSFGGLARSARWLAGA